MELFDFPQDPRKKPVSEALIVALDFETTGLYPETDRIIEIGAVKAFGGRIISEYNYLVDPGIIVPSDASRISGITTDMVRGQATFADLAEELTSFLADAVIIAHNLPFDLGFLTSELARIDRSRPDYLALDSCVLARKTLPGMGSYALSSLAQALGLETGTSHRALDDARTCLLLFSACVRRYDDKAPLETYLQLGSNPDLHR